MTASRSEAQHALIIGASMGGLVAARALSETFASVTIVERDSLPAQPAHRRGVPQSQHTHGLLAGGREALEVLYPGLTSELVGSGALQMDLTHDVRWCIEGAYHHRFKSGLVGMAVSRPCLEYHVRTRTLALPNVRILQEAEVDGLTSSANNARVTGVRLKSASEIPADLVVDASGRGSRAGAWLERMGYSRPSEERVEVGVSYTTRYYRRRGEELGGVLGSVVASTPGNSRAGVGLAQEADRWVVTLAGICGDAAPAEADGFLQFARSLPVPEIAELVAKAEPITDFYTTKFPASVRRRFERMRQAPDGFIAFGDAICSFNPVYGQGMSVAAVEAGVLRTCLVGGIAGLRKRFYASVSPVVDAPWKVAVGNDLRLPGIAGKQDAMTQFLNWYVARLNRRAHNDAGLALAFQRVANLLTAPPSLLAPSVATRVLLARG